MDQLAGVPQLAAQADHQFVLQSSLQTRDATHSARQGEVALAVGRLDHLRDDAARSLEAVVDVPARAGPAKPRERERAGGVALGNVPGRIQPHHEERHASRARASQRGQALGGLLVADAEARPNPLNVVATGLHGAEERLVGHHDRRGEIAVEKHLQELPA